VDKPILDSVTSKGHIYTLGTAAAAAAASSWAGKPAGVPIAPLKRSQYQLQRQAVVVPTGSTQDAIIGAVVANDLESAVLVFVDPGSGIGAAQATSLNAGSAQFNVVAVVDSGSKLTDIDTKISALTAGPLGAQSGQNPKAPASTR
jgi:hypothetical protein